RAHRWEGLWLGDPDCVAKGVADAHIDTVEAVFRLLGDLHAAIPQRLKGLLAVVRGEGYGEAAGAPGDQRSDLLGGGGIQRGWSGQLQQDLAIGHAGY